MDVRGWSPATVLALLLSAACPGGPASGADADAADDGGIEITSPAAPVLTPCPEGWEEVPPAAPGGVVTCDPWPDGGPAVLTPCPAGWREVTDPETGTVTCDPWPEGGPEDCTAPDEAHFPGEPGCTRIGTPCSAGDDWAVDLPADRPILYVRAGAPAGGDGTRASPFGTIREAMIGVTSGAVVALAKGRYDESVAVPGGVTVWGACVAETVVASPSPSEELGTVYSTGAGGVVRNLRVAGERLGVSATGRARSLELRDVVIAEVVAFGVKVTSGARLTGNGLMVRDTRSAPGPRTAGRGLQARSGATVELQRGAFERNRDVAIVAFDADTAVTLENVVVRDTRSRESDRTGGWGLDVEAGAAVRVARGVFERNRDLGVIAFDAGTAVTLENVVVRDTQSRESDRGWGRGLSVQGGAAVRATRGVFERNRDFGVIAFDAGTTVTLENAVVRDTRSRESDRAWGAGLGVQQGAAVQVTRGVFERNREVAVLAAQMGTTVTLADVVVRDTRSRESDLTGGTGLAVQAGGAVQVTHGVFERNRAVTVFAADTDTTVELEDVVVRDTQGRESDDAWGRGLSVQTGAAVRVTRGVFERNREVAVAAGLSGTSVTLEDVVVRDTLERECALDSCAGLGAGTGIGSYAGAHVDARRFLVTRSALCGVQLAHGQDETGERYPQGGTMDIHDGEVSYNTVCGANVQTEGFDIARLMDNVLFRGNGQNLDMAELPVPDPGTPLPEP